MKKILDLSDRLKDLRDGDKIYEFLKNVNDLTPKGRHDFNDNVYVNLVSVNTKENFDGVFESHKDYIDVQVVIKGKERIYYGERADMEVFQEYNQEKDYDLLKGNDYSFVEYENMQAVEFDVLEPHAPNYAVDKSQEVLKAIVKIKKN